MPDRRTFDVVVIGAGVFGAWTAYCLARSGAKVLLADAYGAANSRASSSGESRIIRMGYGADEIYTRWSKRALELWTEFDTQTGARLFDRTGVLWMARDSEPVASATLATLKKVGVPHKKLTTVEIERRFPQIACDDLDFAIYEPESGVIMARRAVQRVVEEFQKAGGTYQIAEVEAPTGSGLVDALATWSGETLRADNYVFACGPWLPTIFPELLGQRIFPTRQEVYFFGAPPGDKSYAAGNFPTWLDVGMEIYGMPDLENRGVKIASDRHGPPVDPNRVERVAGETLSLVRNYLHRRFPALRDAPVVESRVCQYENTSNGDFLIDRHPNFENVWLVGGGSGHGFKHGPAMGEYVAKLVLEDGDTEPRFSLAAKQTIQKRAVY
ncbi:MAG TPA: FAD-dependent oxidoreductase [Candidatus Dormibacteraeota bacterium]|nr:FAD-dependent oxidoreductase [Candidatus Dormibacteraeota bacterium]